MARRAKERHGWQAMDWYDVPRYYDMVYLPGTSREAEFVLSLADRYGRGSRRWLEPACGTGRIVAELARRGRRVIGYDLNEHALAYARRRLKRRGLKAALLQDNMATYRRPGAFDAAYCAVNSIRYLLSEKDALAHMHATAESLVPGGVYIVGLHLTDYGTRRREMERWVARRGRAEVTTVTMSFPPDRRSRIQEFRTRLRVETPSGQRRFETLWTYRTYDLRQWMQLVGATPFEPVAVFDFNYDAEMEQSLADASEDSLFVLRKP